MKLKIINLLAAISLHTACAQSPVLRIDFPKSLQMEMELMQSIFTDPNPSFDKRMYALLSTNNIHVREIEIKQISFVFYYPQFSNVVESYTEMGAPYKLIWQNENIIRDNEQTNLVPINVVRLHDVRLPRATAELELLFSVKSDTPTGKLEYSRKIINFVLDGKWLPTTTNRLKNY